MKELSRRESWALALAGTLAMAVSFFDRQAFSVLSPTVTRELHLSESEYGWVASAFSLAYLIGAPYAGVLVDRIGARRSMLGAMTAWTLVAALHAFAPGYGALLGLRLALGLAESPSFPAAVQTVQRVLRPTDRARGMSTLFVGMSLGAMLVPPVAIWLQVRWGWRVALALSSCVGLLWIPIWLAVAFNPRARAALDTKSERAPARSWAILRHPAVLRALLAVVAVTPCSVFALAWEAKFYVRQYALHQSDLGGYLMVSAFAYDCGALLFGDLAARRARHADHHDSGPRSAPRALFAIGTACAAIAFVALPFAPTPLLAAVCIGTSAIGRGALVTLLNTDMAARAPRAAVSAAAGIIASAQALIHFAVNPLIGYAVQGAGYRSILIALGAWSMPGAVAWMLWSPAMTNKATRRHEEHEGAGPAGGHTG